MSDAEEHFYRKGTTAPATSAAVPNPAANPSGWSSDEQRAIARHRLSTSDWVLVASFLCTIVAASVATSAVRGPHVNPDVERPEVRAVVVNDLLSRAGQFADPDRTAFCLAFFDGIDPSAAFVSRFADSGQLVVPVSFCQRVAPEVRGRDTFLLAVGKMQWIYGGYVQVLVGDERRDIYTLKRDEDGWRVIRIEPAWRM